MKLFSRKFGTRIVNINGQTVKFINGYAEVSDEFGQEVLKLGLSDLYEDGKQPVYETPKEIQMTSDFKQKEEWFKKECARLQHMVDAHKTKCKELEAEVRLWKAEYEKAHTAAINAGALMQNAAAEQVTGDQHEENASAEAPEENLSEVDARAEFNAMTKAELMKFGVDSGIDMTPVEGKKKEEIIDFLMNIE